VTKQLAGYLTKQAAAALGEKTAVRRRPLRTSRGWAGGLTLRETERQLAEELRYAIAAQHDTGPFAFVQVLANGSVLIRIGERTEIQLPGPAGGEHATGARTAADRAAPPVGAATEAEGCDTDAAQRALHYFLEQASI
jgi:hypothetical protein